MKSPRFWMVMALLLVATVVLHVRGDVDRVPVSQPLSQMPETIGSWKGSDVPLDADVLQVLGKGVFLNRTYYAPIATGLETAGTAVSRPPIGLFIGYFPTQRTGQAIHSPQHCLPGAGWSFETSGVTNLKGDNGRDIQVGEYVITDGTVKAEVLYWYRSHGRSVAGDYEAKLYTLLDSIRYGRTDAALVRIVTPILPDEGHDQAHRRAVGFAEQMDPLLPAFVPN